jgi:hypothetical protein
MRSGHISSPAADDLSQATHSFLKKIREKASILAAVSRGLTSPNALSSNNALKVLQGAAEATVDFPDLEATRQELLAAWTSAADRELNQLEAELKDECAARGWQVEGQWPKLIVERGIDVIIDIKKHKIEVGSARLKDLSATGVMTALETLVPHLRPKNFSPDRFLEELAVAHDTCANDPSDQVEIFKVYRALVIGAQPEKLWRDAAGTHFVPFTIDQFRARLATLLEVGPLRTKKGKELRIFPPLQPRDAIFVYQAAQQRFGYIGRIAFFEADGDQ